MSGIGLLVSNSLAWGLKYLEMATKAWNDKLMVQTVHLISRIDHPINELYHTPVCVQLDDLIQIIRKCIDDMAISIIFAFKSSQISSDVAMMEDGGTNAGIGTYPCIILN